MMVNQSHELNIAAECSSMRRLLEVFSVNQRGIHHYRSLEINTVTKQ